MLVVSNLFSSRPGFKPALVVLVDCWSTSVRSCRRQGAMGECELFEVGIVFIFSDLLFSDLLQTIY